MTDAVPSSRKQRTANVVISDGEQGFVLIVAMWLLILAGSIVALLMLRTMTAGKAANDDVRALIERSALDSVVETVVADRLLYGPRSQWWVVPVTGDIAIGKTNVTVKVSDEAGRLDANSGDLTTIDRALQGLGVTASERARIVTQLAGMRAQKRRIGSTAALEALLARARGAGNTCLSSYFTLISGLIEPNSGAMSSELARALGLVGGNGTSTLGAGSAIRIEARADQGAALTMVVRQGGIADQAMSVASVDHGSVC